MVCLSRHYSDSMVTLVTMVTLITLIKPSRLQGAVKCFFRVTEIGLEEFVRKPKSK